MHARVVWRFMEGLSECFCGVKILNSSQFLEEDFPAISQRRFQYVHIRTVNADSVILRTSSSDEQSRNEARTNQGSRLTSQDKPVLKVVCLL
jgi:hypothetical protein